MTPEDFDGKLEIARKTNSGFFPWVEEKKTFTLWFFRRENNVSTIEKFLDSIEPENAGYDKPSDQLFYRSKSGKMHKVEFIEII